LRLSSSLETNGEAAALGRDLCVALDPNSPGRLVL
jgi:hypothetical protein